MAYYAFIVGVNQDWPEQRHRLGDVGLARCLSHDCGIPKQNIMEVYDERATRSNILHALETLLDRRNANLLAKRKRKRTHEREDGDDDDEMDTLLFYYGGHGKRGVFCTETMVQKEPWIKHSEIIELLEQKFIGGTSVCIIDCCHSGSFGQEVLCRALNVSYCCLMSVPPADIAGEEWTMSECFIRAFKGELLCSGKYHYLSTQKGKHPIKKYQREIGSNASPVDTSKYDNNTSTDKHNMHPSWGKVIEYLADEMARIKCDRLTTLFKGKGMEDGKFLQKPCNFGGNTMQQDSTSNRSIHTTASIPRDLTWMDPLRCKSYTINDGVCVKWVGYTPGNLGSDSGGSPHIGWFPGRILSIISTPNDNDTSNDNSVNWSQEGDVSLIQSTALIELHDVICNSRLTMELPLNHESNIIRSVRSFGFGFDPPARVNVIARLAKSLAYFDTAVLSQTRVKVLWADGEWYSATTLSRNDLPWEEVYWETAFKVAGPCVPLRWDEDDSISFVPTKACVVGNELKTKTLAEKSAINETYDIQSPLDAMLASLTFEGKKLQDDISDQDGLDRWEAYDAEDCVWSPVHLMNKIHSSSIPLKALASHVCYQESEQFSLVFWESDASISLVPLSFLRQRAATADDDDNDNECSDDENSVESTDHADLRKYIDEACYYLHTNSETKTTTEHKYLELGSMAAIVFGIGFKLGFRSRR